MALGGGLSTLSNLCGCTSDNIISAQMVTAEGTLVVASSNSNPDLLYVLAGAGQFFGVVTEITLQAYPKSILNTSDGTLWTGSIIFSSTQAETVFKVLKSLSEDTNAQQRGCVS